MEYAIFEMIKKYADHFILSAPDNFVILSSILKLLNDAATTNMESGLNHCLVKEEHLSESDFKINFEQNCYRLTNSENTVTNISEECGYKSKAYFIRLFKEKKGITPSEYRKQMLSKFT